MLSNGSIQRQKESFSPVKAPYRFLSVVTSHRDHKETGLAN